MSSLGLQQALLLEGITQAMEAVLDTKGEAAENARAGLLQFETEAVRCLLIHMASDASVDATSLRAYAEDPARLKEIRAAVFGALPILRDFPLVARSGED